MNCVKVKQIYTRYVNSKYKLWSRVWLVLFSKQNNKMQVRDMVYWTKQLLRITRMPYSHNIINNYTFSVFIKRLQFMTI